MTALSPRPLLPVLGLVALVCLPCLFNGYALDDELARHDGQNAAIVGEVHPPWYYWGLRYWEGIPNQSVLYRPMTIFSFGWVNLGSPGFETFAQHLCNLLLHLLAVYLSWLLLMGLGVGAGLAQLGALAFGLCGIHGEVVAGLVGRSELLGFVFGLGACLLAGRGRLIWAGLCLFCAYSSKESALAWAPFLFCYLWVKGDWQRWGAAGLVAGLPLLAFLLARYAVIHDIDGGAAAGVFSYAQNPLSHVSPAIRMMTGVELLGLGLVKCLAPLGLSSLYGPGMLAPVSGPGDLGFLLSLLVLGGWLVVGLVYARRWPLLFLAMAAFLGFAFLTSNIPLTIGTIFGERLYYMPSLFLPLLVALFGAGLQARLPARFHRPALLLFACWMLGQAAALCERCLAFRDLETVFVTDARRHPQAADLQIKAGYMFMDKDPDQALDWFRKGLAVDEEFPDAWASIARIHQRRGAWEQAETNYRRALQCRYLAASGVEDRTIQDLCDVLEHRGKHRELVAFCQEVLRRKPAHYMANIALLTTASRVGIPPVEQGRLQRRAAQHLGNDAALALLRAMLEAEHGKGDRAQRRQLLGYLHDAWKAVAAQPRFGVLTLRGLISLASLAKELGETGLARGCFDELLRHPRLDEATKARLRKEREALK